MIEIEAPGGVVVEFPDGTPPDVIKGAMQKKFGQTGALGQFGSGTAAGIGQALDFPGNMLRKGMTALGLPEPQNPSIGGVEIPILGGGGYAERTMDPFVTASDPKTAGQRVARGVGEAVGAGAVSAPVAGIGTLGGMGTSAVGNASSGLAGGLTAEATDSPWAQMAASIIGGNIGQRGATAVQRAGHTRAAVKDVPSAAALKAKGGKMIEDAVKGGSVASPTYTKTLKGAIDAEAKDAGMISPTGRITTSYPKVSEAMKMVNDYAGQKMTPTQGREMRRLLRDAAQSADKEEARIASSMLKKFDTWAEAVVPGIKEGNRVYSRAMRGKEIDDTIAIAKTRPQAANTALSNEFANVQRQGIRGDMTYPPELEKAVARAAKGGPTRQAAAGLGKLAPTPGNITRSALALGPTVAGATTMGGPIAGAIAGGSVAGTGLVARALADRLAKGDAKLASAIARNGGELPEMRDPAVQQIIARLLAQQTTGPGAPGE